MTQDEMQIQNQVLAQLKQRLRNALRDIVQCDAYKCNYCGKVRIYLKGDTPNTNCYCNAGIDPTKFVARELIKYGVIRGTMEKVADVTSSMGTYLGEIMEGYLQTIVINEDGSLEVMPKGE